MSASRHDGSSNPLIRQVVDRLHVSATDEEVIRAIKRSLKRRWREDPANRDALHALCQDARAHHQYNQMQYNHIMRGI